MRMRAAHLRAKAARFSGLHTVPGCCAMPSR
nr:MAG TPA: hypothetical protein [Caudoviricetes sp.]DAH95936.1 MAG TPA: hypothetical protein [Caudoviricetes sp.]